MSSLGVATLGSDFDQSGLAAGLRNSESLSVNFMKNWQRIWTSAAGFIMANVISRIIGGIRDIGKEMIAAVSSFQTLTLQIEGLVARELVNLSGGTLEFSDALERSGIHAKKLLDWVKEMAVKTPFTVESLSRTFSTAMAMGFVSDEAKDLTTSIGNFTAGMGLGNDVMERIIYNFGQMKAAGKVTGTELRDLARGALLPVTDILKQMQVDLGMTNISFDSFREKVTSGEIDVQHFFDTFMTMADRDFAGAMERMSRTWEGVTGNVKDFVQAILGAEVLGPTFDKLTGYAADFLDALMSGDVGDAFTGLGRSLARLADIDLGDPADMAERLASGVRNLAGALDRFAVHEDVFKLLSDFGVSDDAISFLRGLADGFKWVQKNVRLLGAAFVAFQVAPAAISVVSWVADLFMGLSMLFSGGFGVGMTALSTAFAAAGGWVILAIVGIIVAVTAFALAWNNNWGGMKDKLTEFWTSIQPTLSSVKEGITTALSFLSDFWEGSIKPVLLDMKEVFFTTLSFLSDVWEESAKPALLDMKESFSTALSFLSDLWQNTLLPALETVWAFLQDNIFPIFVVVGEFISGLFSEQISNASNIWTDIFLPVIMAVGDYFETSLLPLLTAISDFFSAVFNVAVQVAAGLWQNVLLPALESVWAFLQDDIFPLFVSFGEYLSSLLTPILESFSAVWESSILPALKSAWETIENSLMPVLGLLYSMFSVKLSDAISTVSGWVSKHLTPAFETLKGAVAGVTSFIEDLTNSLNNIELPDFLTPGSPTPFENGLRGISDALAEVQSIGLPDYLTAGIPSTFENGLMGISSALDDVSSVGLPSMNASFSVDDYSSVEQSLNASAASIASSGGSDRPQVVFNFKDTTLDEAQLDRALELAGNAYG